MIRVFTFHTEVDMNACTKFDDNPLNGSHDLQLKHKCQASGGIHTWSWTSFCSDPHTTLVGVQSSEFNI